MAIRLHIQENRVRLSVGGDTIHLSATEKMPVYPDAYTGAYEVTPTEAEQSLVTHGLMMTDDVTVYAIASDYVGSGIPRRSSTDITASGATVSVPSGFYDNPASKSVASGSAKPAASISASSANKTIGNSTITLSKTVANTPQVTAGYVSSGTQGNTSIELTASMTTKGATTYHPSTTDQSVPATTYLTGAQTFKAVTTSNLTAENIKDGVTVKIGDSTDDDCVTSVTGSYTGETPNLQAKPNINPTTSSQTIQADSGYDGLSSVQINAMPSGTEGTPTATKGTVSNHAISVTPSVTNSAGYISGGTHNGTAVSVSASELVSGTKSITANGTGIDVTNYATVDVAVPSSSPTIQSLSVTPSTSQQTFNSSSVDGYKPVVVDAMPSGTVTAPSTITGSSASVSTGTNTLTLSKTVSVTPSVTTAGYVSSGTAGNSNVSLTASVTTKGATTYTPTTSNQTISSGTYLTGTQTISGDANLVAGNIKSGTTIFGVTGTYTGGGGTLTVATKTITKTATGQTLSFTSLSGQPKYWFLRATTNVSSSGSTTYYYVTDLFYDGTNIKGNTFRIGSTRRVQNITSGISQSYSNGTLTITAGSSSTATPGQFYGASNFGYELVYIY